ncbi:hypothetical protein IWX49DRAFT_395084 [Phyllosticta citricarpa]|uniref:Uncharacterized protein n=2 Tax=Phyllosticta TaxID=121621 RepID=A0ABR1MEI3_9PEZI
MVFLTSNRVRSAAFYRSCSCSWRSTWASARVQQKHVLQAAWIQLQVSNVGEDSLFHVLHKLSAPLTRFSAGQRKETPSMHSLHVADLSVSTKSHLAAAVLWNATTNKPRPISSQLPIGDKHIWTSRRRRSRPGPQLHVPTYLATLTDGMGVGRRSAALLVPFPRGAPPNVNGALIDILVARSRTPTSSAAQLCMVCLCYAKAERDKQQPLRFCAATRPGFGGSDRS